MADTDVRDETWEDRERRLGIVFGVFLLSLASAALGLGPIIVEAVLGGLFGYALAAALVLVWGERTRPKNSPGWVLVVLLWLVLLVVVIIAADVSSRALFMAALLMLGTAVLARHESGLSPSMLLGGGVTAALFLTGRIFAADSWAGSPDRLGSGEAVWIALAVLLAVAAATFEHERLMRRKAAGTPAAWTTFRLGFLTAWTIIVFSLREEVQWGRLFVIFGADLRGQAGQMLLIGILAAAIAVAAFAFRPAKKPPQDPGAGSPPRGHAPPREQR